MLGIIALCLALPFLLPPLARSSSWLPIHCASRSLFGKPCPLCGMTRGLNLLMRGHLSEAQSLNILVLPTFLFFLLQLAYRSTASFFKDLSRFARADLMAHLFGFATYLAYAIAFILVKW